MSLVRVLEPEVMDTDEDARAYDSMDHAAVNAAFCDALLSHNPGLAYALDVGTGTCLLPIELCRRAPAARIKAIDLSAAMRQNTHMKVLSLNGYYDMATPFFGAEYDLKHMQIDPTLQKNVIFHYYESGHMVYINPAVTAQFKKDLDAFYDSTSRGQ